METYTFLRQIADSWVLLAMFIFFLGAGVWAFWPGQSRNREDASMIPFRNETPKKACSGTCTTCACQSDAPKMKEPFNV